MIPGIDDGSASMKDTIALLQKYEQLGYEKVVTTPHVMSDYYINTPEIINSGLQNVRKAIQENKVNIAIEAAAGI